MKSSQDKKEMHGKAGAFPCIFDAVLGRFSSDLFNESVIRHTRQPSVRLLVSALATLLVAPGARADWVIAPSVTARETWTDNASLTSQKAGSQWVTEVSPGLRVTNRTPRLEASLDYRLNALNYSGERPTGTDRVTQQLSGAMRAKVVPDTFFVDADYHISLQPVSAFGPQTQNDYTTTNRQEVRSWRVNPVFMHQFGAFATAQASYTRDSVDGGNIGLGSSEGDSLLLSLTSGASFQKVTWGMSASSQNVDTAALPQTHNRTVNANLGWSLTRQLRWTLSGGYDRYTYEALSDKTQGANWSTGLSWTPSARTTIEGTLGRRYYGDSYSFRLMHRSRRTVWNVTYGDDVTSTRSQFLLPSTVDTAALLNQMFMANYPDPLQRALIVAAYMAATGLPPSLPNSVNYFSNRYVLQKQFNASVALRASRSTAVLSVYRTRREALTQGTADSPLLGSNNFSLNDNVSQAGGSASLNYQVSGRTQLSLSSAFMRAESLSLDLRSRSRTTSASASHQFGRNTHGSLSVRRTNGNAGLSATPYTENSVSAQLTFQL